MMGRTQKHYICCNISRYLACAKEWCSLTAAEDQTLGAMMHQQIPPPSAPLPLAPSFTPPFCLSWLPRNLLAPTHLLQSPVRGGVYPSNSSSLAEAAPKAMVWGVTSTSCYVTLILLCLFHHLSPSSPSPSINTFSVLIYLQVHCAHQYISLFNMHINNIHYLLKFFEISIYHEMNKS